MSDHRASEGGSPFRRPQQPGRTGTRFKQSPSAPRASRPQATRYAQPTGAPRAHFSAPGAYRAPARRKAPVVPLVIAIAAIVLLGVGIFGFALPAALSGGACTVESGRDVTVEIPEGSSGDAIAGILSENHVVDDPQEYYASVERLDAAQQIKPGTYALSTHMAPDDVVNQLVAGPNVEGAKLTVQEGLTVDQTAAQVESALGIPADDFLAQAKASNYVDDYPFLAGAYNDSLEGYLYPKTYEFDGEPDADTVIRTLLDQFQTETAGLGLEDGANGLSSQEIVTMASLIERETARDDERPIVASVIYNRLKDGMRLQIDAAIVYARGGGSDTVTYDDLEIDSPYNVYQHEGLTPGPICSPSVASIEAAMNPADTDYLYYVVNDLSEGTHAFSDNEQQFEQDRQRYYDLLEGRGE